MTTEPRDDLEPEQREDREASVAPDPDPVREPDHGVVPVPDPAPEPEPEPEPEDAGPESDPAGGAIPLEGDVLGGGGEPCPNCGAPVPGDSDLVCVRCGFDFSKLRVHETRTGRPVEVSDEGEDTADALPIIGPGRGGMLLPQFIAGAGAIILVLGYLLGARGLFPLLEPDPDTGAVASATFGQRIAGLGRGLALIVVWSAGTCGALVIVGSLNARPIGPAVLGLFRVLAIVVLVRLLTFIDLGSRSIELGLEIALQVAAFVGLVMAFIGLRLHDALVTCAITLLLIVGVWALGLLITAVGVA